jgi:NAD(P)-dependent dehydrogenase (short-subunit alcohol dehydrogenase family)
MNHLFSLENKIAIVTGGSGFFGTPISIALAEAGAMVIIASRNVEKCREFAASIRDKGGLAEGMALDLESEDSIKGFVSEIKQRYGRVDILVNNAVSREGFNNLEDIEKESWTKAQSINATGLMLITQSVVRIMREQNWGSIINIGSIQGAVGPNFRVYGDTGMTSPVNYTYDKWGMVGFTKWIANYYGKYNIRANCISPGGYGPGVAQMKDKEEFVENYINLTPLRRFATDDDVKGPVVFMASDASAFITGQNLLVDGGWTSW